MEKIKKLSPESPLTSGTYLESNKSFFDSTKSALAQITDLYDFTWPMVTALWNLRWEVAGYMYVRGEEVTKEELYKKFVNNEKFNRPNLYRSCIEFSWEKQKEDIAKIILINLFAYHESWIENILSELGKNTKTRQKGLQFPSSSGKRGAMDVINELLINMSSVMSNAFYKYYSSNKKFSLSKLNNLLLVYRYFKECRNCIVHSGGLATQKLVDASNLYDSLSDTDINMKKKPEYNVFSLNAPVKLNITGVVGFTDIILQIITTIDAELLKTQEAETVFIKRIKKNVGSKPKGVDKLAKGRAKAIRSIVQQSKFAMPERTDEIEKILLREKIIK